MIRANAVLMFPKGAGCGNELAKWIVHGRPELDMYGYDIRRFCPGNSFDFADLFVHGGGGWDQSYQTVLLQLQVPHDTAISFVLKIDHFPTSFSLFSPFQFS